MTTRMRSRGCAGRPPGDPESTVTSYSWAPAPRSAPAPSVQTVKVAVARGDAPPPDDQAVALDSGVARVKWTTAPALPSGVSRTTRSPDAVARASNPVGGYPWTPTPRMPYRTLRRLVRSPGYGNDATTFGAARPIRTRSFSGSPT